MLDGRVLGAPVLSEPLVSGAAMIPVLVDPDDAGAYETLLDRDPLEGALDIESVER